MLCELCYRSGTELLRKVLCASKSLLALYLQIRFPMCQKWRVIFLHKSILNITDIKIASKSHIHSLHVGDNKAKQNICGKTCLKVATWHTMGWQNKFKTDLGEINCHSGMAEADDMAVYHAQCQTFHTVVLNVQVLT
jgi:hypothetical protein